MDVSRLLAVVTDIEREYENGLSESLRDLIQQYTGARDSPSRDNSLSIQEALDSLLASAEHSLLVQYPPSKAAVLDAIGGSGRVGPGFRQRLTGILSVAGQTTAGIVAGLTELQADLGAFRKACNQTRAGLESLGVTPHVLPIGAFEAGVLIPEALVDRKLGTLAKELELWNKIVRSFQEVAGEEEREVTVARLTSGSYEVYLPLGLLAAGLVSRTIDKVLEWYLKILEIRKRRLELRDLGAPVAEVAAVKKHERELLDNEIHTLAAELVKGPHLKVDATRRNELETQLVIHIRQIARFVDNGGTIEVDSTPPEPPKEPTPPEGDNATPEATNEYERQKKELRSRRTTFDEVSRILEAGRSLRRLPERHDPILQLPDSDPRGDAADPEKATRRKRI